MEELPKRRGRLAKAAQEPKVEEAPEKEPPKVRGKRKAVAAPETLVEKPEKKAATKKTKDTEHAVSTEQSIGAQENGSSEEVVEKKAPVKKSGRGAKKATNGDLEAVVEEPKAKGKKTAPSKDSKAKVEENAVVAKEEPAAPATKRGAASKSNSTKQSVPEAEEPVTVSKPVAKGRGKAKDKTDKQEVNDDLPVQKPDEVEPTKPTARGRKKVAAVADAPAETAASKPQSKTVASPKTRSTRTRKVVVPMIEADPEPAPVTSKSRKKTTNNDTNGDIPTVTQRKRTKAPVDEKDEEADTAPPKEKKTKVTAAAAAPKMNKCATDYGSLNFALDDGNKQWNYKISSWNVAGLRGWVGKGGLEFIDHEQPDILCVQETKCTEDQLPEEARQIKGYHPYWLCKPGGYAGVAIYSKKMPIHVVYGLGDEEQDTDGRLLTAEYEKFYLVCVYVPNAGKKLVTLPKRLRWNEKFHQYLRELDAKKPVILCGDMNVAHEEIDLANPKTNRRNAGFTQEERDGMSELLSHGFVDTYRRLYPEQKSAYTFWTYMGGARAKNVGWRLDYFITSERLADKVTDNVIRSQVYGSDHCPVTLFLNI